MATTSRPGRASTWSAGQGGWRHGGRGIQGIGSFCRSCGCCGARELWGHLRSPRDRRGRFRIRPGPEGAGGGRQHHWRASETTNHVLASNPRADEYIQSREKLSSIYICGDFVRVGPSRPAGAVRGVGFARGDVSCRRCAPAHTGDTRAECGGSNARI